jgi:uncharacterized membrane protein (UPF0127 family)
MIRNTARQSVIAEKISIADSFFSRFMGLMGKKTLPEGSCLIITPCNSIHMFFMRFPIDALFLDKDNTVVYILEGIKPWRLSKIVWNAHSVIELPQGTIRKSRTSEGDRLIID